MHQDLKNFIWLYLRTVFMTMMPLALVAFISIPYTLGGAPGDPVASISGADSHMT